MQAIQRGLFSLLLLGFFLVQAQDTSEADLQTQLSAALETINQLETRLATEQSALSNLRVQLVQEVSNREQALMQQQTGYAALEQRLAAEQTALSSLRIKYVQDVAQRETQIAELKTATTTSSSGIQERLNRSLVRNAELSANIRELEKLATSTGDLSNLETANAQLQQRLSLEQQSLADLRVKFVQEVSNRETQLSQEKANYDALAQRLATEQQALSTLRIKYVQDLAAAKEATPVEEVALAPAASSNGQIKALNTLITSLSNQNAQLRAEARATATTSPNVTQVDNSGLQTRLNRSLLRNAELATRNRELQANLNAVPTETPASSNPGQLRALNTLISSLSNQNSGLRAQLRALVTPAATPTPASNTYVIQSGDTLSSIALALYGDAERWPDIAAANGISEGQTLNLVVGQAINIP